jgi:hypothetical protein
MAERDMRPLLICMDGPAEGHWMRFAATGQRPAVGDVVFLTERTGELAYHGAGQFREGVRIEYAYTITGVEERAPLRGPVAWAKHTPTEGR